MNGSNLAKCKESIASTLLSMSRNKKRVLVVLFDIAVIFLASFLTIQMQSKYLLDDKWDNVAWLFYLAPVTAIPIFSMFCLYQAVHRFIDTRFFIAAISAVFVHALIIAVAGVIITTDGFIIALLINYLLLTVLFVTGSRWIARELLLDAIKSKKRRSNVIIYGAGEAGVELLDILQKDSKYNPVALIDDKKELHGTEIHGMKIYATSQLEGLLKKYHVEEVLLAIPSAARARKQEIIADLEKHQVSILTVPSLDDIVSGRYSVQDVTEVSVEDLLHRSQRDPDPKLLSMCITNKCVMVTGAGGSIGSELCRQIIRLNPTKLILFEISEHALYQIDREIGSFTRKGGAYFRNAEIIPILGTVTDKERVKTILETFNVDTIYHAAAYKHVPLVEVNPNVGVVNNAIGTWCTACAAMEAKVETFVLVSTDKAVRPTNVMGASKRLAELAVQALAGCDFAKTRYVIVRFGNVLGSSGSVVPLFKEQIRRGGPVTITHPDIIRYFMTIPEAAQLVIQAGSMGAEGDVFVLDMGEPVKIMDLARRLIALSGLSVRDEYRPNGDIEIKITGLRPGEKLYEELLIGGDVSATEHPQIMRAHEVELPYSEMVQIIARLEHLSDKGDVASLRKLMETVVSGYKPQCDIADPVWNTCQSVEIKLAYH